MQSVSMKLKFLLAFGFVICHCIQFDRKMTGVVFSPFVKVEENGGGYPTTDSYTHQNVKTMLEVVATKFSRVIIHYAGGPTPRRSSSFDTTFWYEASTWVVERTTEAAAEINHERNAKAISILIGIYLDKFDRDDSDNTRAAINVAINAAHRANSIYPGTVEGVMFSQSIINVRNFHFTKSTLKWIKFIRNLGPNINVKIGTEQVCILPPKPEEYDDSKRYQRHMEDWRIRENAIKESDFIICVFSGHLSVKQPVYFQEGWPTWDTFLIRFLKIVESMKPDFQVMIETAYSSGISSTEHFKNVLDSLIKTGFRQNISIWLNGAFYNPWKMKWGWWKLTRNDMIDTPEGYMEAISGLSAHVPRNPTKISSTTTLQIVPKYATVPSSPLTTTHLMPNSTISGEISRDIRITITTVSPLPAMPLHTSRSTTVSQEAIRSLKSPILNKVSPVNTPVSTTTVSLSKFLEEKAKNTIPFEAIIGLAVGLVAVVLITAGIIFFVVKKLKNFRMNVLTRREIHQFKHGLRGEAAALLCYDRGASASALKLPYDKSLEIPKRALGIVRDQVLGEGLHGRVCKAFIKKSKNNYVEVALKMLKHDSPSAAIKGFLSEIKILTYIGQHSNIVSICGAYTAEMEKCVVYIALELCPLGSLHKYLLSYQNTVKERRNCSWNKYYANTITFHDGVPYKDMVRWAHEIASGMEHLGRKNVIHADLATRNVLLSADRTAKITDFGLSRRMYEYQEYIKQTQEPLPWRSMAVESLKKQNFSVQSDVWSYGVTLWEIYSLSETPFPGMTWSLDFVERLENGLRLQQPHFAGSDLYKIMSDCWRLQPEDRPTFTRLKDLTHLLSETYCV